MCVLYTLFYSLESKTKLKIGAELSDHKNTVKLFTNFGHFFIIFLVLKKLEWASVRTTTLILTQSINWHRNIVAEHKTFS